MYHNSLSLDIMSLSHATHRKHRTFFLSLSTLSLLLKRLSLSQLLLSPINLIFTLPRNFLGKPIPETLTQITESIFICNLTKPLFLAYHRFRLFCEYNQEVLGYIYRLVSPHSSSKREYHSISGL